MMAAYACYGCASRTLLNTRNYHNRPKEVRLPPSNTVQPHPPPKWAFRGNPLPIAAYSSTCSRTMALPASTKRLVKERAGPSYEYKEVSMPSPQGDELLVKVGKVALCGTDINLYLWNDGMNVCARAKGVCVHIATFPDSSLFSVF